MSLVRWVDVCRLARSRNWRPSSAQSGARGWSTQPAGSQLQDRTIWNVSSTAVGGGVAEMLNVLLGYAEVLMSPSVLHDPQTAGLATALASAGARVAWRSHIGVDWQNDATRSAWSFLRPYLAAAEMYVFSRRECARVDTGREGHDHTAIDRSLLAEEPAPR